MQHVARHHCDSAQAAQHNFSTQALIHSSGRIHFLIVYLQLMRLIHGQPVFLLCLLQVLAPYDSEDAPGLLKAAIRDPDPVIFLENEILYGQAFPVSQEVCCRYCWGGQQECLTRPQLQQAASHGDISSSRSSKRQQASL